VFISKPDALFQQHQNNGALYTSVPVDVWETINQHRNLIASSPDTAINLHMIHSFAACLHNVADWMTEYIASLCKSDTASTEDHGLELICCLANDAAVHVEELLRFSESSSQWWLRDKNRNLQAVGQRVQKLFEAPLEAHLRCGRRCIARLAEIVSHDVHVALVSKLYSKEWISGSGLTEVAIATISDYLKDLRTFLLPFWTEELLHSVLREVILNYAIALLQGPPASIPTKSSQLFSLLRSFSSHSPAISQAPLLNELAISRISADMSMLNAFFGQFVNANTLFEHMSIMSDVLLMLTVDCDVAIQYATSRFEELPLAIEVIASLVFSDSRFIILFL